MARRLWLRCLLHSSIERVLQLRVKDLKYRELLRDQAAHAEEHDPRHRRGSAHRREGLPDLAPGAAANTGIVFRRIDLDPAGGDQGASRTRWATRGCRRAWRKTACAVSTVEHLMSALAGLGVDNAYVDLTAAGSADHGRQRRPVRVPAAVGGHRGAGRAEEVHPHPEAGRGERRRQVGALRAAQRLQARPDHRFRPSGVRQVAPVGHRRFRHHFLRQGSEPRAHLRLHAGCRERCARRGWRWAAASTTPS